MDADDKAGPIQFLIGLKPSKKRDILQVCSADEDRQPLVEIRPSSFKSRPIEETPPAAEMLPPGLISSYFWLMKTSYSKIVQFLMF